MQIPLIDNALCGRIGFRCAFCGLPLYSRLLRIVIIAMLLFTFCTPASFGTPLTETLREDDSEDKAAQEILDMASDELRAQLEDYLLQIAQLDLETQQAIEEYNSAHDRLLAITNDIAQKEIDLEVLNRAYAIQTQQLSERAVMFYKGGDLALVEMLLEATSIQNFIARLNYLSIINVKDTSRKERISQEKTALEESLAKLIIDREEAASLDFELKARKIEIENRNKLKTDVLVEQNPELAELVRAYYIVELRREAILAANLSYSSNQPGNVAAKSPVETALAYRGTSYVWGGADKSGFDGPGLVKFVFSQHGVDLPHSATGQATVGTLVPTQASLQPSDVVFFGSPVRHAGIYVGNGFFVHAPNPGEVVKVSLLDERTDYAGARRYQWQSRTGNPL
jgi:peptidoglycan hydrolase CwlO-like protein